MLRKRNHDGREGFAPLVNPIRIKYESLKGCEVDTRLLGMMAEYSDYVEKYTGHKPTPGEIVAAGLEEIFKLDKGFIKWREEKQSGTEQLPKVDPSAVSSPVVRNKTNAES